MEMREYIIYLLENYNKISCDIKQLQFELETFQNLLPEEMIESMNFSSNFERKAHSCSLSDKTSTIAIIYEKLSQRVNKEAEEEIIKKIKASKYELGKLDYCIGRLDPKIKDVIKGYYLDKKSWGHLKGELFMSDSVLNRNRKKGIDKLAEMYSIGI
ncbi:hypothetical protein N4T77_15005 [Clostridium sp. CX1]|uniref:hypothetical protein n=1 Tax=Clostridium sp. CX1 TaxID=2978346 RepID=UPI0021C17C9D|nr:hypothetical protein [Clostridium sp. CX1]MCT8977906.1 hypothetical protein [Clostridium sp. CX1]